MTFLEKFYLVIVSGSVSVLVSVITTRVSWHAQKKQALSDVKDDVVNLMNELEVALLNDAPESVKPIIDRVLENYSVLRMDKVLLEGFSSAYSIYSFHTAGGYGNNPGRLCSDLEKLAEIKRELH